MICIQFSHYSLSKLFVSGCQDIKIRYYIKIKYSLQLITLVRIYLTIFMSQRKLYLLSTLEQKNQLTLRRTNYTPIYLLFRKVIFIWHFNIHPIEAGIKGKILLFMLFFCSSSHCLNSPNLIFEHSIFLKF